MVRHMVAAGVACALLGCAGGEREAALLASQVEGGIERLHERQREVIGALADVQRAAVDERWEDIYTRAESGYRAGEGVAPDAPLTPEQRAGAAAVAAAARERLLDDIAARQNELERQSRSNADAVVAMQRELERYLLTRADAADARRRMRELLEQITGVDIESLAIAPGMND